MTRVTTERAQEILHAAARRGIEHVDEVAKFAADLIDARAENTRLAHLAGQATGLILERDHYRERAQSLRARFDWAQSIAASAMRQGLAECRRLRVQIADAAEELDRHWSERRAVAVRVGCQPGSDLGREVGDMVDAVGALMVELRAACRDRDEARAIVEGRTAPPTDAEIAAHAAVGGKWRVRARWSRSGDRQTVDTVNSWAPQIAALLREQTDTHWWATDASDVPCAWPTVTP